MQYENIPLELMDPKFHILEVKCSLLEFLCQKKISATEIGRTGHLLFLRFST
jgi:hypothetical protein